MEKRTRSGELNKRTFNKIPKRDLRKYALENNNASTCLKKKIMKKSMLERIKEEIDKTKSSRFLIAKIVCRSNLHLVNRPSSRNVR